MSGLILVVALVFFIVVVVVIVSNRSFLNFKNSLGKDCFLSAFHFQPMNTSGDCSKTVATDEAVAIQQSAVAEQPGNPPVTTPAVTAAKAALIQHENT